MSGDLVRRGRRSRNAEQREHLRQARPRQRHPHRRALECDRVLEGPLDGQPGIPEGHLQVDRIGPLAVAQHKDGTAAEGHLQRRREDHTSELQSLMRTWYAVFGWKKTKYS